MSAFSDSVKTVLLIIVSILGAGLGYISRQWGLEKTLKWSRFMFSIFAALFMLIILRTICTVLGLSYEWTLIIVGLFSWLGTDVTVAVLERIVYKKLGLSHVYVKSQASNCTSDPIKPGGVYTVDELQESEIRAKESAVTQ